MAGYRGCIRALYTATCTVSRRRPNRGQVRPTMGTKYWGHGFHAGLDAAHIRTLPIPELGKVCTGPTWATSRDFGSSLVRVMSESVL